MDGVTKGKCCRCCCCIEDEDDDFDKDVEDAVETISGKR
jgi:hypothetical protein